MHRSGVGTGFWLAVLSAAGCGQAWAVETTLVADAHVNAARPAVNSGAISNVNVGGGYTGLMQFDLGLLPGGTTAAQISRAVLRVYVNRVDTAGLVSVAPATGAWSEYGVTYATMPGMGSAAQVFTVSVAGAFVAVDVTALVQGWVAAPATNFGVALTAGTAVLQLDSKENDLTGHAATLEVETVSQGATGAAGPVGPVGPQGPVGVAGPAGLTGAAGAPGPVGPAGPVGPQGPGGATGVAGPSGAVGPVGPAGARGDPGPQGIAGVQGVPGAKGDTGLSGPAGAQGAAGPVGLQFRGAYQSTTNYALADGVMWQGAGYVSLVAGNHGNTPDGSPGQWALFAAAGAAGATGATGGTGAAGPSGPAGSAATVQVGTVTTGAAGSAAAVVNSGTASAAVLNFTIPRGVAGSGGGATGTGGSTSGVPYASMVHAVSYSAVYYSVNNVNQSATETASVLTWVPAGCTASNLAVYSQQNATITVTLRVGIPGAMSDSALSCTVGSGQSCAGTGSVAVPAGGFVDLAIYHTDSTPSAVWTAVSCN